MVIYIKTLYFKTVPKSNGFANTPKVSTSHSSSYLLCDPATPHPPMQVRGQRATKQQFYLKQGISAGNEKYYDQHEAQTTAPIRCWVFSELHPCQSLAVFLRSFCCSSVCSPFVFSSV